MNNSNLPSLSLPIGTLNNNALFRFGKDTYTLSFSKVPGGDYNIQLFHHQAEAQGKKPLTVLGSIKTEYICDILYRIDEILKN